MGKNRWVLIFLLAASAHGQVQMLTTDKQGNVLNPTGANFPSAIPLKINGTAFQSAPGISKYYGTNASGTLGYFNFPTGTIESTTAILMGDGSGNAIASNVTNSDAFLDVRTTCTTCDGELAFIAGNPGSTSSLKYSLLLGSYGADFKLLSGGDTLIDVPTTFALNAGTTITLNAGSKYAKVTTGGVLDVSTGFSIGGTPLPFVGGTTGQVLTKNSNNDYDWKWAAPPTPTATATATATSTPTPSATWTPLPFTSLSDVPHSYSGAALQHVRVNAGATGLEFVATPTPTSTPTATATATATATYTPTPTPVGTGIALEDSNGVFQSLITTSAGVASAITDETGTGNMVFSTSPALSGTPSSTNLSITGTAGAGFLSLVAQSANPSAPAAGTVIFHASTTQGFTRFEQDNEAATNLVLGRDNVFIAKNTTVSTINKGQVVYNTTSSTGAVPNIALAKADSATTLPCVGVALDNIAANAFGQIMVAGVIDNFNTNSFNTGDEIYVSTTTAGALQNTAPATVGQFNQRVGTVLNKGIGNGSILVDLAPFVAPVQVMMKSVTFVVDGAGIVLGTGTKNPVKIPFGGALAGWTTMCKPSCSITMDVFRAADGAGLPVTSIVGLTGTKPFITTAVENKGTDFTNWTSTTLTANDNLAISLSGITAATYVELTLYYK